MWLLQGTTNSNQGVPYSKGETFQGALLNPRIVSINSVLILLDAHKKVPSVSHNICVGNHKPKLMKADTHTEMLNWYCLLSFWDLCVMSFKRSLLHSLKINLSVGNFVTRTNFYQHTKQTSISFYTALLLCWSLYNCFSLNFFFFCIWFLWRP